MLKVLGLFKREVSRVFPETCLGSKGIGELSRKLSGHLH